MIRKPYNDIEKMIVEAANGNEPAFDEQSWQKMEALLDKEEKRKRPFVFWFLLLIGLSTVGFLTWKFQPYWQNESMVPISENSATNPERDQSTSSGSNGQTSANKIIYKNSATKKAILPAPVPAKPGNNLKTADQQKGKNRLSITGELPASDNAMKAKSQSTIGMQEIKVVKEKADWQPEKIKEINPAIASGILLRKNYLPGKPGSSLPIENKISILQKTPAKKTEPKASRVFVTASLGTETNGTKIFTGAKHTSRWGLGAGYQANKHLSIQAAFYRSTKKYAAVGNDYKTTPGTYWNMVDIKTVDANCLVYEIPVSVQYDFSPGKKIHFFTSVGLSAYIMKKENYEYYYYRNGSAYTAAATYSGNKNIFSIAKINPGIIYRINGRMLVSGSPAFSLPLAGVGEGKVKLYSSEFNLGIKYFPFRAR